VKKRIVIAEDHAIVRAGLRLLVCSDEEYEVVGEAEDGHKAIDLAKTLQPDLMLMDLTMPRMNGMEAIREIKRQCPQTKIIILTVHNSDEFILEGLRAGADGYVLKEASQAELKMAIKNILKGKSYICPGISEKVIDGYLKGKAELTPKTLMSSLTQREREVLKLIAEGYKNREVADLLCISIKTVEKHRENVMKKLDLHNASALTAFAMEKGLIEKKSQIH
jgi:DNA-binding NarL/FixJ family response regulator